MANPAKTMACPCGGADYAGCCGRFHRGALPQTAEQLMRSRYSAYALGLMDYVRDTWHPRTRSTDLQNEAGIKWLGLEVRRHVDGQDEATVEFIARYKQNGRAHRLHEVSRFVREQGRWFYLNGSFPDN
jgi:SEC-C motif-containing protein